jgi:hypothetical protein
MTAGPATAVAAGQITRDSIAAAVTATKLVMIEEASAMLPQIKARIASAEALSQKIEAPGKNRRGLSRCPQHPSLEDGAHFGDVELRRHMSKR